MLSLVVTSIITACVTLLKGAFSVLSLLFKLLVRIVKLAACLVPMTIIALLLTSALFVYMAFAGKDPLPVAFFFHPDNLPFMTSLGSLMLTVRDLRGAYPGVPGAAILIGAAILFLPVTAVLLIAHSFVALTPVLIYLLAADLAVYLIYGIISGKTPFSQISGRYFCLFPGSARRRDERNYRAWLKRHSEEFKNDTYGRSRDPEDDRERRRRRRIDEYYGEENYDDNGYDEDDYEDNLDSRRRRIHRDDHEYEEYDPHDRRQAPADTRNRPFDFFAGCDDQASVERKYRTLAKIYHPDNQNGDTNAIQEINAQYTEAKRRFRR